jgi:hypothetical protein
LPTLDVGSSRAVVGTTGVVLPVNLHRTVCFTDDGGADSLVSSNWWSRTLTSSASTSPEADEGATEKLGRAVKECGRWSV